MYGDPAHLDEIAASLDSRAEQISDRADELIARARHAQWQSTAAEAMRTQAREIAADFRAVARHYREAAEAVRAHARAVRRTLAWIADIERWVKRAVADAWDRITAVTGPAGDLVDAGVDVASDALASAGSFLGIGDGPQEPDPADVALCQQTWPPPGHKDWLAHADLARVA